MKPGRKSKSAGISEKFNEDKMNADKEAELAARRQAALEGGDAGEDEDAKSAYQMLQDMRWVYRMVDGRKKLLELVKGDNRQFVGMVRELLKIESAIMAASIRKEGPSQQDNRMTFVILKGLEEEKIFDVTDDSVDLKQIATVMTPDGGEYSH